MIKVLANSSRLEPSRASTIFKSGGRLQYRLAHTEGFTLSQRTKIRKIMKKIVETHHTFGMKSIDLFPYELDGIEVELEICNPDARDGSNPDESTQIFDHL